MDQFVGNFVKKLRKKRRMTLKSLSELTNLSPGYLSLIERGHSSLTITNLHKICQALQITMPGLFAHLEDTQKYVKKENRRIIFEEPDSIRYEALTEGARPISVICMHIYDNTTHHSSPHVADEWGLVLEGSMSFAFGEQEYILNAGDSIYIPAGNLHVYQKTSDIPCISVWVTLNLTGEGRPAPSSGNFIRSLSRHEV